VFILVCLQALEELELTPVDGEVGILRGMKNRGFDIADLALPGQEATGV